VLPLEGHERVLDAGCGSGSLAIEVKKAFPRISLNAVDADGNILYRAKEKKGNLEINFQKAWLQQLPFPDKSFDTAYSSLVFHHLNSESKTAAMKEIYRVLKKSGRFLLVDFGKPQAFFSIFSWFTVLLEEGRDNYEGRISAMLSEAGFRVSEKGRYRFNITFWEAIKEENLKDHQPL